MYYSPLPHQIRVKICIMQSSAVGIYGNDFTHCKYASKHISRDVDISRIIALLYQGANALLIILFSISKFAKRRLIKVFF